MTPDIRTARLRINELRPDDASTLFSYRTDLGVMLKKVGMRQEAHFHQSLFWRGEWVDDVVFGLLRSEWMEP